MKTLKLIVLMLLAANFVMAQVTTSQGQGAGIDGNYNSNFGYFAGNSIPTDKTSNTNLGALAGRYQQGANNTLIGMGAGQGQENQTASLESSVAIGRGALISGSGARNVAVGYEAGQNITGANNTFIGSQAGRDAVCSGGQNTGIGASSLNSLSTGGYNLAMGNSAGKSTTEGYQNVFIGDQAGQNNVTGNYNVYLGQGAGGNALGSNNICIGYGAGAIGNIGSDQLYIESSNDVATPLIYGDFATKQVGIGTSDVPRDDNGAALYMLAVAGKTITAEVQVMLPSEWPDYVFADDYHLMSLTDLEAEIATLGHLPGVPSAEEVEENGHALGKMDAILLEKIEELTLHLIDMNKEMEKLRERNETLETRLSEVEEK